MTYAEYKVFKVASMDESYRLSVAGYIGDAGSVNLLLISGINKYDFNAII